jgi:hypothetical protein
LNVTKVPWRWIGGIVMGGRGWRVIFQIREEEVFELLEMHICAV